MSEELSVAFSDSLNEEITGTLLDLSEIGLDGIMEDGVLKDIPLLRTVMAIYKIGSSIKERHNLKKLVVFLNELNKGIGSEEQRREYQERFQNEAKFRNQELEYLLVLIDRYISYDKPKMLGKLYLAYLQNEIDWVQFCTYSELIDRFLPGDFDILCRKSVYNLSGFSINDNLIRLASLGLYFQTGEQAANSTTLSKPEILFTYHRSKLGKRFVQLLSEKQ